MIPRIGFGYDVHQFAPDRRLVISGIEIPYESGLLGHSDADVATHALIDALLGAAALGDIGALFPDSDKKFKDIDSMILLKETVRRLDSAGYNIGNVDVTIVAQAPKMRPYINDMIRTLASCLECDPNRVSVKATTTEHLGFTGRKEGIAAYAVASIYKTLSNNS